MKKSVGILGSTGSIGLQALEVIRENKSGFDIKVLTANRNIEKLAEQAEEFAPELVVVRDENLADKLSNKLAHLDINIKTGEKGMELASSWPGTELMLVALVGFSGVYPTINAIRNNMDIALANKEALVAGGSIVKKELRESKSSLIPVDSEHSAIFQSLQGEDKNRVEKLILTASGGPFFSLKKEDLKDITPKEALKHPSWNMGNKVTIDSATMMNKGLEVIEAFWLFDFPYEGIEVLIHPQSLVHSLVEFVDGTLKAELGTADMRRPIQYAFTYPERSKNSFSRLELMDKKLEFFTPDLETFSCLKLAYEAGRKGGTLPCVMNAANEVAVEYFLKKKLKFLDIPDIIKTTMEKHRVVYDPTLEEIIKTDKEARKQAAKLINSR